MPLLAQLIGLLPGEDPDEDWDFDDRLFDEITEVTRALVDSADLGLVPELEEHLETFLAVERRVIEPGCDQAIEPGAVGVGVPGSADVLMVDGLTGTVSA